MDGKSLQTGKMFQVTDSVHLYRVKPITASEQGTRRTKAPDQGGSYLTLHRPVFAGLGKASDRGSGVVLAMGNGPANGTLPVGVEEAKEPQLIAHFPALRA
jgi:hypothetical protein